MSSAYSLVRGLQGRSRLLNSNNLTLKLRAGMAATYRSGDHGASTFWWVLFDFLTPVMCVVMFWPITELLLDLSHPFERTFHGADLLPLASVLILGSIRELESTCKSAPDFPQHEKKRHLGLFFAIALLCGYAILHYYALTHEIPKETDHHISKGLTGISQISLSAALLSGAFCFWLKSLKPLP